MYYLFIYYVSFKCNTSNIYHAVIMFYMYVYLLDYVYIMLYITYYMIHT